MRLDVKPEMTPPALLELLRVLDQAAISDLDGGVWTRSWKCRPTPQATVDIVVRVSDTPKMREVLARRGFTVKPRDTAERLCARQWFRVKSLTCTHRP